MSFHLRMYHKFMGGSIQIKLCVWTVAYENYCFICSKYNEHIKYNNVHKSLLCCVQCWIPATGDGRSLLISDSIGVSKLGLGWTSVWAVSGVWGGTSVLMEGAIAGGSTDSPGWTKMRIELWKAFRHSSSSISVPSTRKTRGRCSSSSFSCPVKHGTCKYIQSILI